MEKNTNRVIRICRLWYVWASDVESYGIANDNSVNVILKSGKLWNEILFTPGTGRIVERAVLDDAGRAYEQELSVDIPGEDEIMIEWASENDLRPIIIKVDQNNGTKIYGDLLNPVRLKITWNTETSSSGISFTRKSKDRGRWIYSDNGSGS